MLKKNSTWKRKNAVVRSGDTLVTDGRSSDTIIVIMGPSGVGKSTFINTLLNINVATVGHDLISCTSDLKHIIRPDPFNRQRRLVIVDTPGFDDTYLDDAEILRKISAWLGTSYTCNMKLAGVIYLHEITQSRMLGTTLKNFKMFRKLCGEDALSSVILGTTKWSKVDNATGNDRVQQLKDNYWKGMIQNGSKVFKFDDTTKSAWEMVDHLLRKSRLNGDILQLQQELVDLDKILPDTDAGKELRYSLEEFLKTQKDKGTQEQLQKTLVAIRALKVESLKLGY
ncbi:P-loop containing nucleoside triphosphate hydrolase protein [Cyathus striatus]|nr:P-loop containing nucleoside triphosphate hydrolase protein [Cyathus striatus]